jgi:hypothetical protein
VAAAQCAALSVALNDVPLAANAPEKVLRSELSRRLFFGPFFGLSLRKSLLKLAIFRSEGYKLRFQIARSGQSRDLGLARSEKLRLQTKLVLLQSINFFGKEATRTRRKRRRRSRVVSEKIFGSSSLPVVLETDRTRGVSRDDIVRVRIVCEKTFVIEGGKKRHFCFWREEFQISERSADFRNKSKKKSEFKEDQKKSYVIEN